MSEDLRCFRCHRETRWYGIDGQTGVGVHLSPPITPDGDRYNGGVKPQPDRDGSRYSDCQGLPCGCKPPN